MDILHVLLRLIHIVGGVMWVGLGVATAFYIGPALRNSGENGLRFMKAMFEKTTFGVIFGIASVSTIVAGILLYIVSSSHLYFSGAGNAVLGTGALFGILAFGHGTAATGKYTTAMQKLLTEHVKDGQSISADGLAAIRETAAKVGANSRISAILSIIALILMATARYL